MTQLTTLTPIQVGLFVDLNLIQRVSVFATKHDSLSTENCLVCGILRARAFFLVCSSFCDSTARTNKLYEVPEFIDLNDDSKVIDDDIWIKLDLNRVRVQIMRVKKSKGMYDYEKKAKLKELAIELVVLETQLIMERI